MTTEYILNLYQFNAWANKRILDTASQISPEQMQAETNPSFGSVHNTLVHIMSAQWLWLNRWRGVSLNAFLDPKTFPDLKSIRSRWDEIERETSSFVLTCTEEKLAQIVSYTNFRGEIHGYMLWQEMLHQVNHATQHRSEVALILTGWNYSPGGMDFLNFVDFKRSSEKNKN
jgi:uncharacterized damage-inducible protein DinB